MNKQEAFNYISSEIKGFDKKNSLFGQINKAVDVWWVEPRLDKFEADFNLVLFHNKEKVFFLFEIKKNSIPVEKLKIRKSNRFHLEIFINSEFKDKFSGISFKNFLINKIEYK